MFISLIQICLIMSGINSHKFPEYFKFGAATASYQIEGGWNADGKSENIWDYQTHTFPDKISDRSNGDIACDSYNKIDDDVRILKDMKVDFYRFSLSWSRILPTGFPNKINELGVKYYKKLIDKLLENGIEPMVTLFHWDLPQSLQDLGGWANIKMADYFEDYARVCFQEFGDKVKTWITINEPYQICQLAYAEERLAPYYKSDGLGSYLCGHTLIIAHANAYNMYKKEFYRFQKGRVGITVETSSWEPASNSNDDINASKRMMHMYYGWFTHPIFSKEGDYPPIMRKLIDAKSKEQGFTKSRLPYFSETEITEIRGSFDFLGLNHYTALLCRNIDISTKNPSFLEDTAVDVFPNKNWVGTARDIFRVVPWSIRNVLKWIAENYSNPEVIITENGYAGFANETINDYGRIDYIKGYLSEVLKAIHEDKCNVTAYTAWSLMDNYEWTDGYTMRFGMHYVDFNNPDRPRIPKKSAYLYQNIISTRVINDINPDCYSN